MQNNEARVPVYINDKQAVNALTTLQGEADKLRKKMYDALADGNKKGSDAAQRELKKVNKSMADVKKQAFDTNKVLKNLNGASMNDLRKATRALERDMNGLNRNTTEWKKKAGDLSKVKAEMRKVRSEMGGGSSGGKGGLLGAAKGLLPAFGWAALISGAVALGKKLYNLTAQTMEYRQEVQKLTGLTGKNLSNLTAEIEATAKTFGKEFNETLVASNAYAKTMGIEHSKAMDLINKGFIAGADGSGEFLDSLREYGPQFKAAGVDAETAISIMTQSIKDGVFSDKGADTIKEGMLRLREMTPAAKEALEGIGISSAQMQQDLERGNITVFQAMQKVSTKLAELPPQSSEVGTAIADIFGGPGEDAGLEFIKTIGKVQGGMDQLVEQTGETGKAQAELLEANNKLNKAWSDLLGTGTGTFTKWKAASKTFIAEGLTGMVSGIQKLRNWFIDLYNNSLPFRALIGGIGAAFKQNVNTMVTAAKYLWNNTKTIFKIIGAALKGDFSEIKSIAKEGFSGAKNELAEGWEKSKQIAKDYVEEVKNGKIEMKSVVELTNEAAKAQANLNQKQATAVENAVTSAKEVQKIIEDAIEPDLAAELKELDAESAAVQSTLKTGTAVAKKAQADAKQIVDEAKALQDEANALLFNEMSLSDQQDAELAFYQEKLDALLISEEQFQAFKTEIDERYTSKRMQNMVAYFDIANQLANTLASFTEAAESRKLNAIQDQVDSGVISEEEGTKQKEAIQKKYAEKQKKIAIAQALIGGAMAVVQLWANKSTMPSPANEIYKGVMTAVIAGTTLAQVSKIRSQQFADGRYNVVGASDGRTYSARYGGNMQSGIVSGGPVLLNEHGNETILTAEHTRNIMSLDPGLMDAVMSYRAPQRAEGNYSNAESGNNMAAEQINALNTLNTILASGIGVNYYGDNGMKDAIDKDSEMQNRLAGG